MTDRTQNENKETNEIIIDLFASNLPGSTKDGDLIQKALRDQLVESIRSSITRPTSNNSSAVTRFIDESGRNVFFVDGTRGAGKTTLFKMIMGMETVDKGTFEVGETVKIGYADQTHKDIDPTKTVFQVVCSGQEYIRVGGKEINARAYLSRFNFTGGDQEKLCSVLSGGERNRLHLALTLRAEANVLLLDEPTNDIDVNTLRALEEGLENFAGCAVVISHDRWFLDRICTHILSFEGNSDVVFYEGLYSEYEEYKRKQLGDVEPKRVRYRNLMTD